MHRRSFLQLLAALGLAPFLPRKALAAPSSQQLPLAGQSHVTFNEAELALYNALRDSGYVTKYQLWGDYPTPGGVKCKFAFPQLRLGMMVRKEPFADACIIDTVRADNPPSPQGWIVAEFSPDLLGFFPPEMRDSLRRLVEDLMRFAEARPYNG